MFLAFLKGFEASYPNLFLHTAELSGKLVEVLLRNKFADFFANRLVENCM